MGSDPIAPSGRRRKFWGWELEGEGLSRSEIERLGSAFAGRFGLDGVRIQEPLRVDELVLRAARRDLPGRESLVGGEPAHRVAADLAWLLVARTVEVIGGETALQRARKSSTSGGVMEREAA